MDTLEAIFTRHSVSRINPDPVPRDLVEKLLSAAVQAPNHYKVRPWRFVVVQGTARERLGDLLAQILLEAQPGLPPSALEKERQKPLRAPVIIVAGVEPVDDPRVIEVENICAVAAACENLLLAANAMGLVGMWRTGMMATNVNVKSLLGFKPDQTIVAFLYIGYGIDQEQGYPQRPSFEDRTAWMD